MKKRKIFLSYFLNFFITRRINANKKKIAPTIKKPNLIVADNDAIKGTNDANAGVSLSMMSKFMFSIMSKIPAIIGVKLM